MLGRTWNGGLENAGDDRTVLVNLHSLLSKKSVNCACKAQSEQDRWGTWSDAIAEYVYQTGVDSEDWNVLKAYCEAQFQAFAGAYVHAEGMFRRIDSHCALSVGLLKRCPWRLKPSGKTSAPSYPVIQASPKRLCQLPTRRMSKKTWKKHSKRYKP